MHGNVTVTVLRMRAYAFCVHLHFKELVGRGANSHARVEKKVVGRMQDFSRHLFVVYMVS